MCINAPAVGQRHSAPMLTVPLPDPTHQAVLLPAGAVLLRRARPHDAIYHIARGRLAMGLLGPDGLAHQLGWIEGPCWLDPGSAVLGQAPLMDVVADTPVEARAVPLAEFSADLGTLPAPTLALVRDLAQAHRQQAELAVSRLGKDAEARCAEWLLRHVEPAPDASPQPAVTLRQRKRSIAAQLGIAPETFSRVLRQLRERGLIAGRGRQLRLLNVNGLRSLAGA
ncbi:Crp/Fnr family transcriptional regulator [Ottowia pentelensis]